MLPLFSSEYVYSFSLSSFSLRKYDYLPVYKGLGRRVLGRMMGEWSKGDCSALLDLFLKKSSRY